MTSTTATSTPAVAEASTPAAADASAPSRFSGIHPLLFAAYPVLFLWSQNLGETEPARRDPAARRLRRGRGRRDLRARPRVLGDRRRGALIVTPLVIGLLMYGHAASLLDDFESGASSSRPAGSRSWSSASSRRSGSRRGWVATRRHSRSTAGRGDPGRRHARPHRPVPGECRRQRPGLDGGPATASGHDDRPEARRLLAHLRSLRVRSLAASCCTASRTTCPPGCASRASRSSTTATPTTSGPAFRSRRR